MKTKVCINCENEYPLTEEFWHKREDTAVKAGYRFSGRCRECQKVYNALMKRNQRQRDKKNKVREYAK